MEVFSGTPTLVEWLSRELEVSNVIQVSFLWPRCAPERQLGLNGAKYAELRS